LKIEAIILDIGGVIWLPNGPPLSEKWATRCGLNSEAFDRIVYGSEWLKQALVGDITSEQMWDNIGTVLNLSEIDVRELERDYWKGTWNIELLDYLRTFKPYHKLGIVSDAESSAREMAKEWVNEELFDVIIYSAEEGVCKPDPQIFRSALKKLGVGSGSALFVDDKATNVEGARQLGIHAIQYKNFSHLINTFKNYVGVLHGFHWEKVAYQQLEFLMGKKYVSSIQTHNKRMNQILARITRQNWLSPPLYLLEVDRK
jgi:putative hydrolase of the HAD superfamily